MRLPNYMVWQTRRLQTLHFYPVIPKSLTHLKFDRGILATPYMYSHRFGQIAINLLPWYGLREQYHMKDGLALKNRTYLITS
jgi:hypothetical protein